MTGQIITKLERRMGGKRYGLKKRGLWYRQNGCGYTDRQSEAWSLIYDEAKKHEYLNGDEPVVISPLDPPDWLNSRDALAPVLETLNEEEWTRLWLLLRGRCAFPYRSRNVCRLMCHLTLPPRDLARAIAEAMEEEPTP